MSGEDWLQKEYAQATTFLCSAPVTHVCSIPHCQPDLFLCPLLSWHHLKPSSLQCLEHPARTGDLIKAPTAHTAVTRSRVQPEKWSFTFFHISLTGLCLSGSVALLKGAPGSLHRFELLPKQHMGPCNKSRLSPEPLCRRAGHLAASKPLREPGRPQRSAGHT